MELFYTNLFCHSFEYNIDQVYKCYISSNVIEFLKSKGIPQHFKYYIEEKPEIPVLEEANRYVIKEYMGKKWRIFVKTTQKTPTSKQIKQIFESENGVPFNFVFNLVYSFYENNSNSSTVGFFEVEYSKGGEDFLKLFDKINPFTERVALCKYLEEYLSQWSKPEILMESISINSSFERAYKECIDGSIFLRHPFYRGFDLVVERKEGVIETRYLFVKKNKKALYILKSLEKHSNNFSLLFLKEMDGTYPRIIQFIFTKLDKKEVFLQCYTKFDYAIDAYTFNCFQQRQKKKVLGFKEVFEEKF